MDNRRDNSLIVEDHRHHTRRESYLSQYFRADFAGLPYIALMLPELGASYPIRGTKWPETQLYMVLYG